MALLVAAFVSRSACHQLVCVCLRTPASCCTILAHAHVAFVVMLCCYYFYSSLNDIFLRNSEVCRLFMHFNLASDSPAYAPFQFDRHCSTKSSLDSCCNLDYPVFCLYLCCIHIYLYVCMPPCSFINEILLYYTSSSRYRRAYL